VSVNLIYLTFGKFPWVRSDSLQGLSLHKTTQKYACSI